MARVLSTPQEKGIPLSKDTPRDWGAALQVEVPVTGGMEIYTDQQVQVGQEDGERFSYGSNQETSTAYIRALEDVLERGRVLGHNALTRTKGIATDPNLIW